MSTAPEARTPTVVERAAAERAADCVLTNLGFWHKAIQESGAGVAILRDPKGKAMLLNDLSEARLLLSGLIAAKPQG